MILATSEDFEIFGCLQTFTFFSHYNGECQYRFTWKDEDNEHHMLEQVHEMCEIERDKCSGCQFELER